MKTGHFTYRAVFGSMLCLAAAWAFSSCTVSPDGPFVYKGTFKSMSVSGPGGRVDEYMARYFLDSLYSVSINGSVHLLKYDSLGRVSAIVSLPDSLHTIYTYTPSGELKAVTRPNGSSEEWEFDSRGRQEVYKRKDWLNGQLVYGELRKNIWQGGNLVSQIVNRPGGVSEEWVFEFADELNPLSRFFNNDFPIPLGFDVYIFSERMLNTAKNIRGQGEFRYSYTLDENNRLSVFYVEALAEDGSWHVERTYSLTYFD